MKKTCNVFPLFVELEQKKFLGPDKLNILKLKDLLKGLLKLINNSLRKYKGN